MKKLLVAAAFAVGLVPLTACCVNPLLCAEACIGCSAGLGQIATASASLPGMAKGDLPLRARAGSTIVPMAY